VKIFVIGAGAVGSYFGAALALAGHDVTFGVRDTARSRIESAGIRLSGPRGDFQVKRVKHTEKPEHVKGADVVISTVKLYDVKSSATQWRPAIETAGAVICVQNGVDGVSRMRDGAPKARVYGGLAFVSGQADGPGSVRYLSDMSSLTFGGSDSVDNESLRLFASCLDGTANPLEVKLQLVADVALAQWKKFLALATNATLTCLVRRGAGVIYHDLELLALAQKSIDEIFAVGQAEGIALQDEDKTNALATLQGLPPEMVASMHHDLAAGRRLELDGLSGLVSALGRRHGIDTQFHDFAYACLKPHMGGTS
jgi:2-dehydropantoate 2-reductase